MEKIKQQQPAMPVMHHDKRHESAGCAYSPEPMSMLPSEEVRRQLGWFLVSNQREHGR